jgi:carboxyl-terminal processing protease
MPKLADGRACRRAGSGESMPISLRPAVALAPAGMFAVVVALVGCAQLEPLPADPAGRLFARGLDEIGELYIAPVSNRLLALDGADRLSSLDRGLSTAESPGPGSQSEVVLDYRHQEVAAHPEPADDPHAWGALLGQLVVEAKTVSPSVEALSDERIETAVFDGITGGLDRFSRYASPEAARDHRAIRDGFGGVGVTLEVSAGTFRIAAVTPGGPADSAGIRPGDEIVAIDGEPTAGRSEIDVVRQLRGPIPSTVAISIARPGATPEKSFRLRRTLIVLPTVRLTRDGDIVVFRISSFNQNTTQQLVQYLEGALNQAQPPLRGIVLDLRGDPGGLLDQAVSLADVFIRGGPIVATTGRYPASRQLFEAAGDSLAPRIPMVVLINGGSASASEVVAAALQDAGRAVVVGSSSYGKGTVQTIVRLPNGGELTLTWAVLIAPSGYFLNRHGVVPTLCTSDLENDGQSLRVALQRANSVSISPLTPRPRASLSEADWSQLRRSCPARQGDHAIDMTVAERLLADPDLFGQAVHVIARTPKLATGSALPAAASVGRGLTGVFGSLLSPTRFP